MVILETEQTLALIKMSPVLTFFLVCCLLGQDWRIKQQLANYTKRGETNLFNSFSRFSPVTPMLYRYAHAIPSRPRYTVTLHYYLLYMIQIIYLLYTRRIKQVIIRIFFLLYSKCHDYRINIIY